MDERRNIKLIIEFKGTDFHGYQFQNGLRTVEGCLKKALRTMTGEDAVVYSSSRTDGGVHALNMPVNFRTCSKVHLYGMMLGLNSLLPRDLKIKNISEADGGFHARHDAVEKTYLYKVFNFMAPSPVLSDYSWHIRSPLNLAGMRRAAKYLIGG
ncbi:MAG: tRNA pseudouridine(38-40) synthase TruA, partial [Deltaproteobacteria bacterium]|nr:tRNA pseudouridine(38-40) synthase TruA [Deltaproteobacteria bacterium]